MSVGRAPGLELTTLREKTLVDLNRSRLRGWAFIGAVVLVFLAIISWPDLVAVLATAGAAAALLVAAVWVHLSLPDAEEAGESSEDAVDSRDPTTGDSD